MVGNKLWLCDVCALMTLDIIVRRKEAACGKSADSL